MKIGHTSSSLDAWNELFCIKRMSRLSRTTSQREGIPQKLEKTKRSVFWPLVCMDEKPHNTCLSLSPEKYMESSSSGPHCSSVFEVLSFPYFPWVKKCFPSTKFIRTCLKLLARGKRRKHGSVLEPVAILLVIGMQGR